MSNYFKIFFSVLTFSFKVYFTKKPLSLISKKKIYSLNNERDIKFAFKLFKLLRKITSKFFFIKWTCYTSSIVKYYLAGNGKLYFLINQKDNSGHCVYSHDKNFKIIDANFKLIDEFPNQVYLSRKSENSEGEGQS